MSIVRMRNKLTGEFRDADDASVDFIRLKREVGPDGQSKWEQTGDHDVRATMRRAQRAELLETDMGKAAFPLPLNASEPLIGPEYAPHKALTAGEIECGITSQEMKAEQEQDMHMRSLMGMADDNQLKSAREQAERGEGPLASHPSFRRERALSLSTTAIAERSDVEGLEDDEFEDDEDDEPQESASQRKRRLARERKAAKAREAEQDGDESPEED